MSLLDEGAMLRDTYEVEKLLGEGAFAEVYRVRHRFLGRQAMKVFKQSGMSTQDVEGALEEALLLSRLGHANIVRVFDANVIELPGGVHGYFTMEHAPEGTLEKFRRSLGGCLMPVATAVALMKQVCQGLAVAHQESPPIIHRDIKPQNILVGHEKDGLRALVSDFGLARQVNPLTLLATAAGTLAFKPPEAFLREKSDSCAGDVWALGVTFYLLLTDEIPVQVPQQAGWSKNDWFNQPVRPPSELNPCADALLDRIVLMALDHDPARRYRSASEMLAALKCWAPESLGTAPAPSIRQTDSRKTSALGRDDAEGLALVEEALNLQRCGDLAAAANLLEEALRGMPSLRGRHQHKVALWRRGISM